MDDMEAIRQLKARYCRLMDTKDWAGFRQVFTDDTTVDSTDAGGSVVTGGDNFLEFLTAALDQVITVHHCHTPEIEITSPTTASGIWAMEDMVRFPNGLDLHGYGHYHETYERHDGVWRIKSSKLTRLRSDFTQTSTTNP